jgi:nucleoside-specific outer membrane channel protein Tsx
MQKNMACEQEVLIEHALDDCATQDAADAAVRPHHHSSTTTDKASGPIRRAHDGRMALSWVAAVFLLAGSGIAQAQETQPFFRWTDNSVTLLPYGWNYEVDPSEQSTFTFEHVHDSAIGDLFLFVDATRFHGSSSGDDTTWYGEVSPRLSFGKLLDKDLSFALFRQSLFEVKDVLLAAQYERGEDPDLAEAALLGLGFDLDVRKAGLLGPLGKFNYIQLNLYARAELTEGAERGFRDMQVTMVAAYPFTIGGARFLVDGYFDWVLGIGQEAWSYHLNPQVKLDVGNFWGQPEKLYAGLELDFWWNKYQIPNTASFDTNQQAVSLVLKYHF